MNLRRECEVLCRKSKFIINNFKYYECVFHLGTSTTIGVPRSVHLFICSFSGSLQFFSSETCGGGVAFPLYKVHFPPPSPP